MFLFQRIKEPDACPDCGSLAITEASEEQQVEFDQRVGVTRFIDL